MKNGRVFLIVAIGMTIANFGVQAIAAHSDWGYAGSHSFAQCWALLTAWYLTPRAA